MVKTMALAALICSVVIADTSFTVAVTSSYQQISELQSELDVVTKEMLDKLT